MGHRSSRHPEAQTHIVVYREAVSFSGVVLVQRPSVLGTGIVNERRSVRDTYARITMDYPRKIRMLRSDMSRTQRIMPTTEQRKDSLRTMLKYRV